MRVGKRVLMYSLLSINLRLAFDVVDNSDKKYSLRTFMVYVKMHLLLACYVYEIPSLQRYRRITR